MCIPTNPNAPPTFVRHYKIPIASYEPVQEIVDSMLEKGVIRPFNSTYSAPLWPVLKPNGKWRPTIDYRKLNQQVPLTRWPMAYFLMKSSSVEDHLKEIYHVLNQLTTAGAKIALHKGPWCKTKVNYVGLLVGRNGREPQSNRAQAIQSIKTPTNVSELQSFLGVCNYSRQFIENYADIA